MLKRVTPPLTGSQRQSADLAPGFGLRLSLPARPSVGGAPDAPPPPRTIGGEVSRRRCLTGLREPD